MELAGAAWVVRFHMMKPITAMRNNEAHTRGVWPRAMKGVLMAGSCTHTHRGIRYMHEVEQWEWEKDSKCKRAA